jgi:hypothetical protein
VVARKQQKSRPFRRLCVRGERNLPLLYVLTAHVSCLFRCKSLKTSGEYFWTNRYSSSPPLAEWWPKASAKSSLLK